MFLECESFILEETKFKYYHVLVKNLYKISEADVKYDDMIQKERMTEITPREQAKKSQDEDASGKSLLSGLGPAFGEANKKDINTAERNRQKAQIRPTMKNMFS